MAKRVTPKLLVEIASRHQVYLEGLKTGEANKVIELLQAIDKAVRARISGAPLTSYTKRRFDNLIKLIEADITAASEIHRKRLTKELKDIAEYEAGFESRSLNEVVDHEFTLPSVEQLMAAVNTKPLLVKGVDGGKLLQPFLRGIDANARMKITAAIKTGYYTGQTNDQILQAVRGTRAAGYRDGIISRVDHDAKTIVRTAIQHVSQTARTALWEANSDVIKGYRWVATLDGRTSEICRTLDELGEIYELGKGPLPPAHPGCRSTTVAVMDEAFAFLRKGATRSARGEDGVYKVDANLTYYSWLKQQPTSFQDSVIGQARGKLLRSGGITAERFAELQLGKNFYPLTLEQMRKLEPRAFARAGI